MTSRFDLLIIGTGSGNSLITPGLEHLSTAIVERDVFGGTCLNKGCIPTKMFVYAADMVQHVRHAARYGVDAELRGTRWRETRDRVFGRIDPIAAGGEEYRTDRCPNVTVFRGSARFVDTHTVVIDSPDGEQSVTAERIVIAAGARPVIPDIPGLSDVGYYTSDDIMRVDEVPRRLAILGGGFIACEMAHVFEAFGSAITIVNRGNELLKHEDHDIRSRFLEVARERADVRLQTEVLRASRVDGAIRLDLSDGAHLVVDAVLVAAGRLPNSDQLDLASAGFALESDGRVRVNSRQETDIRDVYALGDICSPYQLKHVANHEARVVAHNLEHPERPIESDHRFVPHAVFAWPQVASVGLTEEQARAEGLDIVVKVQNFGDTAYGWAMEDRTGLCKVIADRVTRRLLGAHFIGAHAAMLVQQLIQGMVAGQTVDDMARGQYYIHPSLSEVVENALLGLGDS